MSVKRAFLRGTVWGRTKSDSTNSQFTFQPPWTLAPCLAIIYAISAQIYNTLFFRKVPTYRKPINRRCLFMFFSPCLVHSVIFLDKDIKRYFWPAKALEKWPNFTRRWSIKLDDRVGQDFHNKGFPEDHCSCNRYLEYEILLNCYILWGKVMWGKLHSITKCLFGIYFANVIST